MIGQMTPTPPDLGRPYGSAQERAADAENLIVYWYALEALIALARIPHQNWSGAQAALVDGFSHGGGEQRLMPDAQAERLRRWTALYREELDLIRDVRNRIVRADIVTDPELVGATWLARQVLATVAGARPGEVDQVWARAVAARASS